MSWSCVSNSSGLGETRGDFVAVTEGLKAGQQVVEHGGFQIAQRHARRDRQQARAESRSSILRRATPNEVCEREILYRSFHPPASARAGRQPGHYYRRAAGDLFAQRPAISAQRHRFGDGDIRFTSGRAQNWCADLSPPLSSARSRPPMASIICNRKVRRASRPLRRT